MEPNSLTNQPSSLGPEEALVQWSGVKYTDPAVKAACTQAQHLLCDLRQITSFSELQLPPLTSKNNNHTDLIALL